MRTLYAWLIANVESITTFLLLIAFEAFLFTDFPVSMGVGDKIVLAVFGAILLVLVKSLMGGMPSKSMLTDIVNLILIIAVYAVLLALGFAGYQEEGFYRTVLFSTLGICAVSLMLSVTAAAYTCRHMDEVVSRRMLYLNSNVSLFEITWRYTFNRFVTTFSSVSSLCLIIVFGKMLVEKTVEQGGFA